MNPKINPALLNSLAKAKRDLIRSSLKFSESYYGFMNGTNEAAQMDIRLATLLGIARNACLLEDELKIILEGNRLAHKKPVEPIEEMDNKETVENVKKGNEYSIPNGES